MNLSYVLYFFKIIAVIRDSSVRACRAPKLKNFSIQNFSKILTRSDVTKRYFYTSKKIINEILQQRKTLYFRRILCTRRCKGICVAYKIRAILRGFSY